LHSIQGLSPIIDHTKFHVFTGLGQQLISVLDVGGAGAIDGLAACFPKSLVKLYNLFETRERQESTKEVVSVTSEMRGLQYRVCKAEKLVVRWGTIGIREALARLRHFGDSDGGRFPMKGGFPNGESEWESWCESIDALHEVENGLEKQAQKA
jgi:2-keto-3-deoxy-L-rhamnonate aldolase